MDVVAHVFSSLGGAVVALAAMAFLLRRIIDAQLRKAVEKHRSELEQKSAILKTELSIYAHEQTVGLSRLDAQRSEAIQMLYRHVRNWHVAFKDMVAPDYSHYRESSIFKLWCEGEEKTRKERKSMEEAVSATAILFDKATHDLLLRYVSVASELTSTFADELFDYLINDKDQNAGLLRIDEARKSLATRAQKDLEPLLPCLLAEFRKLMHAERQKDVK